MAVFCLIDKKMFCFLKLFILWSFIKLTLWDLPKVDGTYRHYGTYLIYGTGETYIWVYHNHGGTNLPGRKWIVECLDGEAMTGIQDFVQNFERLETVKCSFSFPNKPPSQGRYPYYPSCYVRNYTTQFHCFDPQDASRTVNTFITALWDNDFLWQLFRTGFDDLQPYKCCKTPHGYYIDYLSCYYMPTHDIYWEYYDATNHFVAFCTNGHIMTGISKKISPWTQLYNIDWIQCCRLGFGPPQGLPPPVTYAGKDGTPVYMSRAAPLIEVPSAYKQQYRKSPVSGMHERNEAIYANHTKVLNPDDESPSPNEVHFWSNRYAPAKPGVSLTHFKV